MGQSRTPLFIVALAVVTNLGIDYLNARWLFTVLMAKALSGLPVLS